MTPSEEPCDAGLTTSGNVEPLLDRGERVGGAELAERDLAERDPVGRRQPAVAQRVLGQDLVGAAHAGVHAASRCRGSRAPRAAPARCRPRRRGRAARRTRRRARTRAAARRGRRRRRSTRPRCPRRSSACLDAGARRERDLALERATALEDGDSRHASRERRPSARPACGSGTTSAIDSPAAAGAGGAAAGAVAGERVVERDLLGDDRADPPHALAQVLVGRAREVQPHRAAAAPVDERRLRRARTRRSRRARAPAGWSCRCSRAA